MNTAATASQRKPAVSHGAFWRWMRSLALQESNALRAYLRLGEVPSCQPLKVDLDDYTRWLATRNRELRNNSRKGPQ